MAPSRMIPMTNMTKLFAAQGVKATIVTTPLNVPLVSKTIERIKTRGGNSTGFCERQRWGKIGRGLQWDSWEIFHWIQTLKETIILQCYYGLQKEHGGEGQKGDLVFFYLLLF